MKTIIKNLLGAAIMMVLPFSFTSCDDILGHWERPVPVQAFMFKQILDAGSSINVKFTVNDENFSVTFKKEGSKYTVQSDNPIDEKQYSFEYDETNGLLVLTKKWDSDASGNYVPQAQLFFNPETNEFYIINAFGFETIFDGNVTVNNLPGSLTDACPDKTQVAIYGYSTIDSDFTYPWGTLTVNYNKAKGETWHNAVDRYKKSQALGGLLVILDSDKNPILDDGDVAIMKKDGTDIYRCYVSYSISPSVIKTNSTDKIGIKDEASFAGPYKAQAISTSVTPIG